jgi:NAD(P)-dependent dehydrogenase (short-subunit alcohol dehydrogenase family)
MTYNLQGKVAIVTGAGRASGMGSAIAMRLAQDGARLVITDVGRPSERFPEYGLGTSEELQQRATEIRAVGAEMLALLVDVTEEDEVEAMVQGAVAHFGRVDILVANAGISSLRLAPSLEWSKAEWEQTVAVNLIGTWSCCKAAATQMVKQGRQDRDHVFPLGQAGHGTPTRLQRDQGRPDQLRAEPGTGAGSPWHQRQ